jgi:hypothetical protein
MKYVVKLAMFAAFVALLYFAIGIVVNYVSTFISNNFTLGNNAIYILHRFKICEAVNLYISLVIATWITNKIINYWM